MAIKCLSDEEIRVQLETLNTKFSSDWQMQAGKLSKTFTFKNFIEAFAYMSKVALYAEKINHHPEWFNVYKRLDVQLTTHEAGGISERDFELASYMETNL